MNLLAFDVRFRPSSAGNLNMSALWSRLWPTGRSFGGGGGGTVPVDHGREWGVNVLEYIDESTYSRPLTPSDANQLSGASPSKRDAIIWGREIVSPLVKPG